MLSPNLPISGTAVPTKPKEEKPKEKTKKPKPKGGFWERNRSIVLAIAIVGSLYALWIIAYMLGYAVPKPPIIIPFR